MGTRVHHIFFITHPLKTYLGSSHVLAIGSDGKASVYNVRDLVRSLGWEDSLEKEMATHSSTLALKIPWMEELGAGYYPWDRKESGTTERLHFRFHFQTWDANRCLFKILISFPVDIYPAVGLLDYIVGLIFILLRNLHTVFHDGYIYLCFYQQSTITPFSLHPCHHLLSFVAIFCCCCDYG